MTSKNFDHEPAANRRSDILDSDVTVVYALTKQIQLTPLES